MGRKRRSKMKCLKCPYLSNILLNYSRPGPGAEDKRDRDFVEGELAWERKLLEQPQVFF